VNTALGLVMHEERADDGESVAEGLAMAFPLKCGGVARVEHVL
jgi:hypothetical protein